MMKSVSGLAAFSLALITAAVPMSAEARTRAFSGTLQGANGRSAQVDHRVERTRGSREASTNVQGSNGHGYETVRSAQWGNGAYQRSEVTRLNNGKSFGRETNATGNGDGSANVTSTFTGPAGTSRTVTGTVTRQR